MATTTTNQKLQSDGEKSGRINHTPHTHTQTVHTTALLALVSAIRFALECVRLVRACCSPLFRLACPSLSVSVFCLCHCCLQRALFPGLWLLLENSDGSFRLIRFFN